MTTSTADPAQPTPSTVVVATDGSVTVTQVSNATTVTYPGVFATPFSPLDLSPTVWLDASDETTITESGGSVSQWDDKSGNGYNLTQATSTYQPTTGTRTLNGLNVLDLDGAEFMQTAALAVTDLTMVAVFVHDAESFILLSGGDGSGYYAGLGQSGSSSTSIAFNMGTMSLRFDGADFAGTTRDDIYNEMNAGAHVVTMKLDDGNFTKKLCPFGYEDNAAFCPDGALAEIIIVDSLLTAQQISDTETYLANKWGITL